MRVALLADPGVRFAVPAPPSGRRLHAPLPPGSANISTARWSKLVTIPRQSRGPSFVSRSKRLVGVAVAAPWFGATSTVTHQ